MEEQNSSRVRVAVMQPYVFPYMGYFSLVSKVDHFIFLDDASFRKKGWINRNVLIINGSPMLFTVPLIGQSQNRAINEINTSGLTDFAKKFRKTVAMKYGKYPYFQNISEIISACFPEHDTKISKIAIESVVQISRYLGLGTKFSIASEDFRNDGLSGAERIIDICIRAGARTYINAEGGRALYKTDEFLSRGVSLEFDMYSERQCSSFFKTEGHVVSSIDALMRFSPDQIRTELNDEIP